MVMLVLCSLFTHGDFTLENTLIHFNTPEMGVYETIVIKQFLTKFDSS